MVFQATMLRNQHIAPRGRGVSMPLYEYACKDCGKNFEALVTGSQKPHCPACESAQLEQQYSAFAVGATGGKGRFGKSATRQSGACGSCGDPRGPGSCSSE